MRCIAWHDFRACPMLDGSLSSSDLLMQIFSHLIVIGHMKISVQLESPTAPRPCS